MVRGVLDVITGLRRSGFQDDDVDIEINMHPADVKEINQTELWGRPIISRKAAQRGHAEIVATITVR